MHRLCAEREINTRQVMPNLRAFVAISLGFENEYRICVVTMESQQIDRR